MDTTINEEKLYALIKKAVSEAVHEEIVKIKLEVC